jgi:hypothetical protein
VFHLFLYFDSHGPKDAGGPRPTGRYIDNSQIIIGKQDSETSHRWATCVSFFLSHTLTTLIIVEKQDSETHNIVGQHA